MLHGLSLLLASTTPSPTPLDVRVFFAKEDLTAEYTRWLAFATVLLALATVWMGLRADIVNRHRADDGERIRRNAARKEIYGVVQALRSRVKFYSEELRRGRPPLSSSEVVAPLISAILTPDVAEAFGEHYEDVVEAAIAVQEAALAVERLVRVVNTASESVELETRNQKTLYQYGKQHNIGMQTRSADFDAIKVAYMRDVTAMRIADATKLVEIVLNDSVAKLNALEQPWLAQVEERPTYPWWHRFPFLVV